MGQKGVQNIPLVEFLLQRQGRVNGEGWLVWIILANAGSLAPGLG